MDIKGLGIPLIGHATGFLDFCPDFRALFPDQILRDCAASPFTNTVR